jgi:hypothetical protein
LFTIDIGYTTENNLKVNKSYTTILSGVQISPTSTISQENPVFVVDYDSRFLNANYIICSALGRKYFATISTDTANRMIITCSCDYLSSFNLSSCPIQVTRNGGIGKPTKYPDNKYPIYPNIKDITSITRSNSILTANGGAYILTVIGGES